MATRLKRTKASQAEDTRLPADDALEPDFSKPEGFDDDEVIRGKLKTLVVYWALVPTVIALVLALGSIAIVAVEDMTLAPRQGAPDAAWADPPELPLGASDGDHKRLTGITDTSHNPSPPARNAPDPGPPSPVPDIPGRQPADDSITGSIPRLLTDLDTLYALTPPVEPELLQRELQAAGLDALHVQAPPVEPELLANELQVAAVPAPAELGSASEPQASADISSHAGAPMVPPTAGTGPDYDAGASAPTLSDDTPARDGQTGTYSAAASSDAAPANPPHALADIAAIGIDDPDGQAADRDHGADATQQTATPSETPMEFQVDVPPIEVVLPQPTSDPVEIASLPAPAEIAIPEAPQPMSVADGAALVEEITAAGGLEPPVDGSVPSIAPTGTVVMGPASVPQEEDQAAAASHDSETAPLASSDENAVRESAVHSNDPTTSVAGLGVQEVAPEAQLELVTPMTAKPFPETQEVIPPARPRTREANALSVPKGLGSRVDSTDTAKPKANPEPPRTSRQSEQGADNAPAATRRRGGSETAHADIVQAVKKLLRKDTSIGKDSELAPRRGRNNSASKTGTVRRQSVRVERSSRPVRWAQPDDVTDEGESVDEYVIEEYLGGPSDIYDAPSRSGRD